MSIPFTELPVSTRRITVVVQLTSEDEDIEKCAICTDDGTLDMTCVVCKRYVCAFCAKSRILVEGGTFDVLCIGCEALPVTTREKIIAFVKELNQ